MLPLPVARPRLLDRIDQPDLAPITLITAPAGYGKSTLARQWEETFPGRVGYVSLNRNSNTLPRMIQQIQSAISTRVAIDTDRDSEVVLDDVLRHLELFASGGQRLAIILDDYHLIENRDVHDAVDILLNQLPPNIHIIILSRTYPPLALGRLTAYGHVRQLTRADLGFTPDEVRQLTSSLPLSPEQVRELTNRAEGWIASIRLAMMSIDLNGDGKDNRYEQLLAALSRNSWLDEYVTEEVLSTLPDDLHEFVLKTAILETLDPDLCDTVLGIDKSRKLLHEARQRIVFLNHPADPTAPLAYHRLFAESVQRIGLRSLPFEERREHHRRAADWFEQHGQMELAIEHAVRAGSWDQAERLVGVTCAPLMDMDQKHSVLFWIRKLPASRRRANDHLAYWYVKQLQHTGQFHEASTELKILLPRWNQSDDPVLKGYASSCEATAAVFNGPDDLALQKWYETLHYMPLERTVERLHAWSLVHQLEFRRGNDEVAEQAYRQAVACREKLPRTQHWWNNQVEVERANHISRRADLVTAEQIYRHQLEHHASWSPGSDARFRYRLASIYLAWNDLDRARTETEHIERTLEHVPVHAWHAEAWLVVAQVYRACGEHTLSRQAFDRLLSLVNEYGGGTIQARAWAWQAGCWIADGKIGLAREWAAQRSPEAQNQAGSMGEDDALIPEIQLMIAEGKPEVASTLAREYIAAATRNKHWLSCINLQIWEAVAQHAMGNDNAAIDALRGAVAHGCQGNVIRPFFPPGHDLRPLLERLLPRLPENEATYLDAILAHLRTTPAKQSMPELPEQPGFTRLLTPSEDRVLAFLGDGLTNREIAAALFVTERTIKKHVSNILSKLGTSNRTAAVSRARELGIL